MTGIINREPVALLSALDMKTRGNSPRTLAGETVLTVDGWQFYTLNNRETRSGATNLITGVGSWTDTSAPVQCQVPESEAWYVHRFSVNCLAALSGAGTYSFLPLVVVGRNTRPMTLGNYSQVYGDTDLPAGQAPGPFWMMPNDICGVWVDQFVNFAVQNPQMGLELEVSRFRI